MDALEENRVKENAGITQNMVEHDIFSELGTITWFLLTLTPQT
jgi:hypothetical protein